MSVINQALSQLVSNQGKTLGHIEKAEVAVVHSRPAWVWMLGGFGLSLAVGGWAVSQQENEVGTLVQSNSLLSSAMVTSELPSPTQNLQTSKVALYRLTPPTEPHSLESMTESTSIQPQLALATKAPIKDKPLLLASLSSSASNKPETQMVVEQVELTPQQLANKAVLRANKALDSNDFNSAVSAYSEALRYAPQNEQVRQKLAALYYGKGDVRKAYDLLQRGIELNHDGETLRIALARLLLKEDQSEAALSPLSYVPASVSVEYLSLRAALAQKSKFNDIALESYQLLTEKDSSNGRWWLGLAIQQERAFMHIKAQESYRQALTKVGLSAQSHAFIRERLQLLAHQEESKSAS